MLKKIFNDGGEDNEKMVYHNDYPAAGIYCVPARGTRFDQ